MGEGFFITEADSRILDEKLTRLTLSTESRCALLVDKSGHLIMARGHFHFVPPDDMGVKASGAFSTLCNIVDVAAAHITTTFHFPGSETIHFGVVNPNIFIVLIYPTPDRNPENKNEEIMKAIQSFAKEVKELFGKHESDVKSAVSLNFISEKINEILKKEP